MTSKNPVLFAVAMMALLVVTSSCKEGSFLERRTDNFKAHYNKYYNANDTYKRGVKSFEEAKTDVDQQLYLNIFRVPTTGRGQDFDKVITKCAEILRKHPRSKWVDNSLLLIGKAYFFKNNYVGAEQKFKEVINSDSPLGDEASFWLGRTLVAAEATGDAIAHLESSLAGEMDKKWRPQLNLLLADLYAQNGDWQNSLDQIEAGLEGVKDDETGGRSQFLKGQILETLEQYEEAAAAYHSVRKYKPLYELAFAAQYNRARMYGLFLDSDEGLKLVDKMARDDKNFDNLEQMDYLEAQIYQKRGDADTALDIYLDMLYPDPSISRPVTGDLKGKVHYALGELHRDISKDFVLSSMYFDTSSTVLRMPAEADQQYTSVAIHDFNENADTFKRFSEVAGNIEEMDSLLFLGTLSDEDFEAELVRIQADRQIAARQKRDEIEKRRAEAGFGGAGGPTGGVSRTSSAAGGSFGFLDHRSEDRIRLGFQSFRATWGERPLVRNWRREEAVAQEVADVASADELDSVTEALELGLAPLDPTAVPRDSLALSQMLTDRANARYELGNVLFLALSMPDSAITWYQKVIDEDSEEEVALRALYAKAEAKGALGQTAEANDIYDRIVQDFPESEFENRAREKLGLEVSTVVRDSMLLAQASYTKAYDTWQAGNLEEAGEFMLLTAYEFHTTEVAAQALLASGIIYTEWAQSELEDFDLGDPIPLREDLFDPEAHEEAIAIRDAELEKERLEKEQEEKRRIAAEERAAKDAASQSDLLAKNQIIDITSEITRRERELRMKRNTLQDLTSEDPSYEDLSAELPRLESELSDKRKELNDLENGTAQPAKEGDATDAIPVMDELENADGVAIGDEDLEEAKAAVEPGPAEDSMDENDATETSEIPETEKEEELKPDYFIREIIPQPYRLIHVYESVEQNYSSTDFADGAKYRKAAIQEELDEKQALIDSVRNAEEAAILAEEEAKRAAENPPADSTIVAPDIDPALSDSLDLASPEIIAENQVEPEQKDPGLGDVPSEALEQPEEMQQAATDRQRAQQQISQAQNVDPNARRDGESRADYEKRMIQQMKAGAVAEVMGEKKEMDFIYLLKKYGSRTSSQKAYLSFVEEFPDLQVISQVLRGTRVFYLTSPSYDSEDASSYFDLDLLPGELRDDAYLEAIEEGSYIVYDFKPAEVVAKKIEIASEEAKGAVPSKPNRVDPVEGSAENAEAGEKRQQVKAGLRPESEEEPSSKPVASEDEEMPKKADLPREPKLVDPPSESVDEKNPPEEEVEVIKETQAAEISSAPEDELLSPSIKDGWAVITSSKPSLREAVVVRDLLLENGIAAQIIPSLSGGKTIYRVAAFVSESKSEATKFLNDNIGKTIPKDSWLTPFEIEGELRRSDVEVSEEDVPKEETEEENTEEAELTEDPSEVNPGAEVIESDNGIQKGWAIIVASKTDIAEAFQAVADLKARGLAPEVIPIEVNGNSIYRVASGLYRTQKEAAAALDLGRGKTLPVDAWISTFDKSEYLDSN